MRRNGVVPKGVQVFLAVEQHVHQSLDALGGDHDRPGDLFGLVGFAAQQLLHKVAHHLVVAVHAIEAALEGVGEHQAADEVTNRDLPVLQLGLEIHVPIGLEGVEVNLAVGALDHRDEVVPVHGDIHGIGAGRFVGLNTQGCHPGVLGDWCVLQKGNGHASFSIHCRRS